MSGRHRPTRLPRSRVGPALRGRRDRHPALAGTAPGGAAASAGRRQSRWNMPMSSFSMSAKASPLTSTTTFLIVPPRKAKGVS